MLQSDILFVGKEPKGRVFVCDSPHTAHCFRTTGPQKFFKHPDGRWIWQGHCGRYSDGTPRPPWHDAEFHRRHAAGDPNYNDADTYKERCV